MNWKEIIEKKLKEYKYTKRHFSSLIGASPQSLNNWMRRNSIPKNKILKISQVLDISVNYLMSFNGNFSTSLLEEINFKLISIEQFSNFIDFGDSHQTLTFEKKYVEVILGKKINKMDHFFLLYGLETDNFIKVEKNNLLILEKIPEKVLCNKIAVYTDGVIRKTVKEELKENVKAFAYVQYVWNGRAV